MTSDQVVWSEQNRLHISYAGLGLTTNQVTGLPSTHGLAVGQTVIVSNTAGTVTKNAYVSAVGGTTADLLGYTSTNLQGDLGNTGVKLFVFGSEYKKGTDTTAVSIEPSFSQLSNKPVIIKDKYEVSGSDASQIGWVEVITEGGDTGYLWYLKGEGEARLRFEDYTEMAVVEGEKKLLTLL